MADVSEVELKAKDEGKKEEVVVSTEEKLVKAAPGLFGISYASWASVVAFLFLLWIFVAMFFWLLLNVAVKMRSNDYKGMTFHIHTVTLSHARRNLAASYTYKRGGSFLFVRSLGRWYSRSGARETKPKSVPWPLLVFVDCSA